MIIAIVAHFDAGNIWDGNFIELLQVLEEMVDKTIVVTSAHGIPAFSVDLPKTMIVRRPNVGYDFYSYRVGMRLALIEPGVEGVLLLNSSILLLDSGRFKQLLVRMCASSSTSAVRGVSASMQFGWHLQSFLLYFSLRHLQREWLKQHFEKIEPANTKFEVILHYEVGFGRALRAANITTEVMFQPTAAQRVCGALAYMRSLTRRQGRKVWLTSAFWRAWRDINWTHFAADAMARDFGLVKTEFVRDNPHRLPDNAVWGVCAPRLRPGIEQFLLRSRPFYAAQSSGLAQLQPQVGAADVSIQFIKGIRHRWINARVAVVVHLFYIELFEEILDDLRHILEPFDLYITTPFEADIPRIFEAAARRRQSVDVVLTVNKGRDVGPFIALFRTGCLGRYDAVLKLHSKKSRYSDKGDHWRRELYKPLCGDTMTVLQSLRLIRHCGCGVVGPFHYFLTNHAYWGANRDHLARILRSCGVHDSAEGQELAFFAGTMFWFAPKALAAVHTATGQALAFEAESGKQDGTMAHAWERAFCLLARHAGYKVSAVAIDGDDIFKHDLQRNRVPVLNVNAERQ